MTFYPNNLLVAAQEYVTDIFENKVHASFVFHNLTHTQDVVAACMEMALYYQLSEEDTQTLLLAAWFHDTGYMAGQGLNHEKLSIEVLKTFATLHAVPENVFDKASACILATRMPQRPKNLIEQIICDADLFHLGTHSADEKSKALRKELNNTGGKHISKEEWAETNFHFLETHQYFTDYARQNLDPSKQEFLKRLRKKYHLKSEPLPVKETGPVATPAPEIKKEDERKERKIREEKPKDDRPVRGIETMFRTTSANHNDLSSMADSKANIMISVNSIIISIMVSVLLEKLNYYPALIVPTIILIGVCLGAIIFSVLATRPNVTSGRFTKEDIDNKKANLLFFGNFHRMTLEEYTWGMTEMMNNRDYLYGSMIKDIYFLGVVLARKYRYLRISYNIFMFGLVAAILAFGIAFFVSESPSTTR